MKASQSWSCGLKCSNHTSRCAHWNPSFFWLMWWPRATSTIMNQSSCKDYAMLESEKEKSNVEIIMIWWLSVVLYMIFKHKIWTPRELVRFLLPSNDISSSGSQHQRFAFTWAGVHVVSTLNTRSQREGYGYTFRCFYLKSQVPSCAKVAE